MHNLKSHFCTSRHGRKDKWRKENLLFSIFYLGWNQMDNGLRQLRIKITEFVHNGIVINGNNLQNWLSFFLC
jgi:hypothetical protein